MINLIKKDNLNIGIVETDFDIFADIINTFDDEQEKKTLLIDIEDSILPDYFKNKLTVAIQSNDLLIGYIIIEFKSTTNSSNVEIKKLFVKEEYQNKDIENLLIESAVYIASEVGCRNITSNIKEEDKLILEFKRAGFYEVAMDEEGVILNANVSSLTVSKKLNDKFRNIEKDSIDYKTLKLVKKISSGRSGNIYLTDDGKILKMFKSTSFTFIKDREETLRYLKTLDIKEIVKPKNLVYYDGVFVGYIMEYLPEGKSIWDDINECSFEKKIERIKAIEKLMRKLHKKNIYICDLNPDNIFIEKNGDIRLIDCDSFVIKKNVINNSVALKYQDPIYKTVSFKTDLYAFSITILQLLINKKIEDEASFTEIQKVYNKNKSKIPVSFKSYFEEIFKTNERIYLTESYEKYLNSMYHNNSELDITAEKSGKISVIILSLILVIIAIIGFVLLKYGK